MEEKELIKIAQEKIDSFNSEELKRAGFLPLDGRYFPAIYYPPITMYPPTDQDEMFENFTYKTANQTSVYFHLPFCPRRCMYCHWVVSVGNSSEEIDFYLKNLEKETQIYKEKLGVKIMSPTSILIGGGTPSMLSPAQTERFLSFLAAEFDLSKCSQITCEVEPTTILGNEGMAKLKVMKKYGINRISLGVQSFDDGILKMTGRLHSSKDAIDAVKQIRLAGFESLSLDLIYGYPGSTLQNWIDTLKTAHSLDIDAYQLYRLRIVPHGAKTGAIKNVFDKSPEVFPSVKDIYIMKGLGMLISSQNEFKETSRRVFCKGPEHNSDYLQDHTDRLYNVLGFGISSWNNLQDRFFINTGKDLADYYSYVNNGKLPVARGKIKTVDDRRRWAICLSLKHHGVSKKMYEKITGTILDNYFGEKIKRLKNFGLLEEDDEMLKLTEKGQFFADEVVIQFYHPDYIPFPKSAYADRELNPYNN